MFNKEEYVQMQLRMRKIQDDVLTEYFQTPAVARHNYLMSLQGRVSTITELEDFKKLLENEIAKMKEKKEKFTKIERIEYRLCRKIYNDVVLAKGLEFDFNKDMIYNYDDQEITVEPITFGEQ
jgi:hypothetical protein